MFRRTYDCMNKYFIYSILSPRYTVYLRSIALCETLKRLAVNLLSENKLKIYHKLSSRNYVLFYLFLLYNIFTLIWHYILCTISPTYICPRQIAGNKCALFYRGMERELSLSASNRSRSGLGRSGPFGRGELPMLFHLAMADKHNSARECRKHRDRSDSAKRDSH